MGNGLNKEETKNKIDELLILVKDDNLDEFVLRFKETKYLNVDIKDIIGFEKEISLFEYLLYNSCLNESLKISNYLFYLKKYDIELIQFLGEMKNVKIHGDVLKIFIEIFDFETFNYTLDNFNKSYYYEDDEVRKTMRKLERYSIYLFEFLIKENNEELMKTFLNKLTVNFYKQLELVKLNKYGRCSEKCIKYLDDKFYYLVVRNYIHEEKTIQTMMEDGANVNHSKYDLSILNFCILNARVDMIELLLKYNVKLDVSKIKHEVMMKIIENQMKSGNIFPITMKTISLISSLENFDDYVNNNKFLLLKFCDEESFNYILSFS